MAATPEAIWCCQATKDEDTKKEKEMSEIDDLRRRVEKLEETVWPRDQHFPPWVPLYPHYLWPIPPPWWTTSPSSPIITSSGDTSGGTT